MPNIIFPDQESIPEGLREFAKKEGDTFVVNVVPEPKLVEFRENNIRLSQERDSLKSAALKLAPVIGENIEEFLARYNDMVAVSKKVTDGQLKTSDAIE